MNIYGPLTTALEPNEIIPDTAELKTNGKPFKLIYKHGKIQWIQDSRAHFIQAFNTPPTITGKGMIIWDKNKNYNSTGVFNVNDGQITVKKNGSYLINLCGHQDVAIFINNIVVNSQKVSEGETSAGYIVITHVGILKRSDIITCFAVQMQDIRSASLSVFALEQP